jgi:murein DD-endopeptidase MepM/ murein hydrolase activator NlpD|tara:strand:- start:2340 stop:3179 length:840 start_codon:yes stop_codon:yes gene_type:complete
MKIRFLICLIFLTTSCTNLSLSKSLSVCSFPQSSPYPGGMVNYSITFNELSLEQDLRVEGLKSIICSGKDNSKNLLIPIPLSFEGDQIEILLSNQLVSTIEIKQQDYRESRITIKNQNLVNPPASMQKRIRKEYAEGVSAKNTFNRKLGNSREMILPLEGIVSSEYGVKRFINGLPRNRHVGLDIASDEGQPVFAPLSGKVILVDNFFYKGNVVYIDHGNGLVSSYSHLSKSLVSLNQSISTGEELGLVGSTGRVTGPHLHWEVYFLGIPLNPEIFIKN